LPARPTSTPPLMIVAIVVTALIGAPALPADGRAARAEAQTLGSGMWEVTTRIDHLDIPGLPEAMVRKIAADPANAKPRAVCIATDPGTPPPVVAFHALNGACTYETWQAEAGGLRAVLVCSPPDGGPGEARVEVTGTYTASTFEVTSETIARDQTGATQLHMRSVLSGKLTSPKKGCTVPEG